MKSLNKTEMRKLLYTLAFTVIGFTASYAQRAERAKLTAEERAQKYAASLQTKLNLTDEQKSKVEKLELDRAKKHEVSRKKDSVAMKAKFEARRVEMKAHEDKLNNILTKEQREKLATERAAMKEKFEKNLKKRGERGVVRDTLNRGKRGEQRERGKRLDSRKNFKATPKTENSKTESKS